MTRDERLERILQYIRQEAPAPTPVHHQFQERDHFARVQVRSQAEGEYLPRDWTGSSASGRVFGGGRWSGGRDV